jgi:hypothetical protein
VLDGTSVDGPAQLLTMRRTASQSFPSFISGLPILGRLRMRQAPMEYNFWVKREAPPLIVAAKSSTYAR